MKNDVHLLYETSDSERFSSKEDADKHELAWAVMCVISNFPLDCEAQSQLQSDLLNEFDIHFKGEIVEISTNPTAHWLKVENEILREKVRQLMSRLAAKEEVIQRLAAGNDNG